LYRLANLWQNYRQKFFPVVFRLVKLLPNKVYRDQTVVWALGIGTQLIASLCLPHAPFSIPYAQKLHPLVGGVFYDSSIQGVVGLSASSSSKDKVFIDEVSVLASGLSN
jgi:hypothetical protein